MRIHIHDLKPDMNVHIDGTEPWLDRLYADFPAQNDQQSRPRIVGDLTLTLEEAGSVLVTGNLSYTPIVSCSRCDLGISWPLSFRLSVRYLPENVNISSKERTLTSADLDAYYLEDNEIDLEGLINDTVQTALPNRVIATTDDGSACRICEADLTNSQVYGQKDDNDASSPFAALKNLKLPH